MRKRISKGLSKIVGEWRENNLIPDPWQESPVKPSSPAVEIHSESAHQSLNPPLIIAAAVSRPLELSPAQILLQDELKLRINQAEKLGEHIQEALALLYWLPSVPA